jgi:hypothetical protein
VHYPEGTTLSNEEFRENRWIADFVACMIDAPGDGAPSESSKRASRSMTSSLLRSIPSPTKIREELEQMVLKDLLGPVGGPEEEIDEPSVRDRYLVGMLAPKRAERAGLSSELIAQDVFARVLNVPTRTVQAWEAGTRRPSQAALRLIQVFRRDPSGVLEIVGMTDAAQAAASLRKARPRARSQKRTPRELTT